MEKFIVVVMLVRCKLILLLVFVFGIKFELIKYGIFSEKVFEFLLLKKKWKKKLGEFGGIWKERRRRNFYGGIGRC